MNVLSLIAAVAEDEEHIDQSHHWLLPETYEIVFGGLASLLIFGLLVWKAGPLVKKGLAARTERVQSQLDVATKEKADATAEADEIRRAKGDIGAERTRLLAEADGQAEALLADGRQRMEREIADLLAKAESDIAAAESRGNDELRAEIAGLAAAAAERVVTDHIDRDTHQELIESFISRVGASSGGAG
ncbi:MAG: hypothetical protein H0U21_07180 [Acidimicrobiia bacterium]|nr:hypothetical protein [Acidimicrobiia bacterium]